MASSGHGDDSEQSKREVDAMIHNISLKEVKSLLKDISQEIDPSVEIRVKDKSGAVRILQRLLEGKQGKEIVSSFVELLYKRRESAVLQTQSSLSCFGEGQASRLEHFVIESEIGSGAFGSVLKCTSLLDQKSYAVKKIILNENDTEESQKMMREVELLSKVNHENVVRYFTCWKEQGTFGSSSSGGSSSERAMEQLTIQFDNSNESPPSLEIQRHYSSETLSYPETRSLSIMYIQMECCNELTLREAIDEGLCRDSKRVWRLLRVSIFTLVLVA